MGAISQAPPDLSFDVSKYQKLDHKQAGHLRHFYNLVSQPDGHWNHFSTADSHEEFDDARRYQLATMAYAAGAAHYHRLPALQGAFKNLLHQIIHKMLLREVWSYWYLASHSGRLFDPDLKELRKPWPDPVVKENIMYSGHLLLMTSLYAMLFDDDEYEREGSLTFRWNPLFWGLGPEEFVYDNRKLQDVILKQMEENEWVGVCCEPNAVFVICNQYPLVAMRYNDIRDGTNVIDEVLPKYKAALTEKGMLGSDGLYASFYAVKQKKAIAARHGAHTAWANAFMNAWNPDFVRSSYDQQTFGFLTNYDGRTQLQASRLALTFRKLVSEEGYDPADKATLLKAREIFPTIPQRIPFETLNWGTFTMMLSELGKQKELSDLLQYADTHLNPQWENGGLFYPRNEVLMDKDWNMTHIEPFSGNSAIGYARLNVEDGQKKMWEHPWTRELLASRPWIESVGYEDGVDFLRAIWDDDMDAMILTMKCWKVESRCLKPTIKNIAAGAWAVYINGRLQSTERLFKSGDLQVEVVVGNEDIDLVVQRVGAAV